MKITLCILILGVMVLGTSGSLWEELRRRESCPNKVGFQEDVEECLGDQKAKLDPFSNGFKDLCSAYKETAPCMQDLTATATRCDVAPADDLIDPYATWREMKRLDMC